jgi:DNA modification methylase
VKPTSLIARLIEVVNEPGDLVVDSAAGGFSVMDVARQLGPNFIGCDIAYQSSAAVGQIAHIRTAHNGRD